MSSDLARAEEGFADYSVKTLILNKVSVILGGRGAEPSLAKDWRSPEASPLEALNLRSMRGLGMTGIERVAPLAWHS